MGMTLDKRNYKRFVETIIEMTNKVGVDNFGKRKIENLTNSGESRRQLAMEAIEKVVSYLKLCDMDVEICDTLNERLPSQSEKVRKQPADLISRIVVVMKQCEMDQELCDFCTLFFNRLEQEYQEVLDSFLELN
ncbi:splicing factor 3B subunit [Trifolium repens]|nr:splicing factor 3B subunit [Trifolium repens]